MEKLRCQRISCDAVFTEDDNPEDSCTYHDGAPIFHDGIKEWSCCKKRSHDFSSFLEIPGCKTGKHTMEKPVFSRKPAPKYRPISAQIHQNNTSTKKTCPRCRQGFFCSDHGSQARDMDPKASNSVGAASSESDSRSQEVYSPPVKKVVDINQPLTCNNKGCGKTFKEKDNHDRACSYHPGPAIFHDRVKGWKCCDVHVKEFDEFMAIPPCTQGWHNADAT